MNLREIVKVFTQDALIFNRVMLKLKSYDKMARKDKDTVLEIENAIEDIQKELDLAYQNSNKTNDIIKSYKDCKRVIENTKNKLLKDLHNL